MQAVHGEALHIAQEEAPTIYEYYEAVATALDSLRADGGEIFYRSSGQLVYGLPIK